MTRFAMYAGLTFVFGLGALAGPKAHADVITTYTLQGPGTGGVATTTGGGTVVGTFQIDQTTYNASTGNGIMATLPFTVSSDPATSLDGQYLYVGPGGGGGILFQGPPGATMLIYMPMNPPVQTGDTSVTNSYVDYSFGRLAAYDPFSQGDYMSATSVSRSPTATPEPTTLTILTAGVMGIVGLGRRRKRKESRQ